MSIDAKHGRYCDDCGRSIKKAHRVFENNDYCSICYPRVFISKPCTQCGKSARVHRLSQDEPICRACARVGRVCLRCEKPIVKAGMISAGRPVCPSCVPHFKAASPCAACGVPSTRLSAMPSAGIFEKVCESCRNKVTHKTCSICRKHRKVVGTTQEGKPYCKACQPGAALSHSCPDCGVDVPGNGQARCRPCLNRMQIFHEVELSTLTLTRDWARVLYRQFANWLFTRQSESPSLMKVFRSHQIFFERIDAQLVNLRELTALELLKTFGTAGLRKHLLVTQFLKESLAIEATAEEKAENADLERIQTKLRENKKQPWGKILTAYAESLAGDALPVRTRRLYIATAEAFCQFAKPSSAPWSDDCARQFLRKKPGLRANLSKFVRYCSRAYGWNVTMPQRSAVKHKLNAPPKTVPYLQKLLQKVSIDGVDKVDRATLVRIIAKSFGFPIKAISDLSANHFQSDAGKLVFVVRGESVIIPPALDDIAREFMSRPR